MSPVSRKEHRGDSNSVGLQIPKERGEATIRALTQRKLINRIYRIEKKNSALLIPLTKRLSNTEMRELVKEVGTITVVEHQFRGAERPPRTLKEALGDNFPRHLLNRLPSSYDVVGDIAVLDLPPDLTKYEWPIAIGIQKVNRNVRVVLAKAGPILGAERVLPTRHIAGENRTQTIHIESGCRFKVDLAKAYFSPRLSHEHERVVKQVEQGENVTDLFSGVGPFAILIAKKLQDIEVNAIDSNPSAVNLIRENMTLNRVRGRMTVWLGDARDVVDRSLAGQASRVIMNHPSASNGFVDVGCKALRKEGGIIHYYTFAEGLNPEDSAIAELEKALKACDWRMRWLAEVRRVREVSPMTWQIAIDAPVVPVS